MATKVKAKKPGAKKRKAATDSFKVKGVNGKSVSFSKSSCHTSKTAAKKQATSIRNKGVRAMVKPGAGGTICVFKGPRMTAAGRKIFQSTHTAR